MTRITLCGAAGEVTGSSYLVETRRARVLVDFGMFQGRRADDDRNRNLDPVDPARLDAVVLTHAHLDHSGRLPLLGREGFEGPIWATAATDDFADLILHDAAHIQQSDAEQASRRLRRAGRSARAPLYDEDDVRRIQPQFKELAYDEEREVAPGIAVRFTEAGHILGSASVSMTVEGKTVVFSGDIGPRGAPFLRDPVPPTRADVVFLESTYGGRDHRSADETVLEFHDILDQSIRNRTKVLIPAFSIGRAQLLLFHLAEYIRGRDLPDFPIYLDSPMAIRATKLYAKHSELFDAQATSLARSGQFRRDLKNLHFLERASESRQLNDDDGPGVVIAGAGMCNGGRILHHFKHHLWRPKTSVVLVGFMAPGTLGRRLVRREPYVRIFGERIAVLAKIHTLGGFSAHAGQTELLEWVEPLARSGAQVVLTHGEEDARTALAAELKRRFDVEARRPMLHDVVELP